MPSILTEYIPATTQTCQTQDTTHRDNATAEELHKSRARESRACRIDTAPVTSKCQICDRYSVQGI
eukprot:2908803-Pleurochrysis_carterae.AAC.4